MGLLPGGQLQQAGLGGALQCNGLLSSNDESLAPTAAVRMQGTSARPSVRRARVAASAIGKCGGLGPEPCDASKSRAT